MTRDDRDDWETVGWCLLASEAFNAQSGVAETFHRLRDTAEDGGAFKVDDVREARWALNRAYRLLEGSIVPLTEGAEPWERPPDVPYGKIRAWIDGDEE